MNTEAARLRPPHARARADDDNPLLTFRARLQHLAVTVKRVRIAVPDGVHRTESPVDQVQDSHRLVGVLQALRGQVIVEQPCDLIARELRELVLQLVPIGC